MIETREIHAELTYIIRHTVLRPHQILDDCKYDTDYKEHSFHVGAFYHNKLISVASFCREKNPDFPSTLQYRLRAMATLSDFTNLGAGSAAVAFAESIIRNRGADLLWCKGRTTVQDYYSKLGFLPHGEVFDYPPIGPHIVMYKRLKQ
ncbi:GNAT family N-acetyltransferase [Planococcus sp. YIM B11945]|uniref:GNAT family N-acetyltransferase n=1 Tax=Planococcus sp. YIM B11945 TaxID=3435410 RepID=UPI003D7CCE6F